VIVKREREKTFESMTRGSFCSCAERTGRHWGGSQVRSKVIAVQRALRCGFHKGTVSTSSRLLLEKAWKTAVMTVRKLDTLGDGGMSGGSHRYF